jgi:predicted ATP-grasp superfamily ATP-dependent carboligase
MELIERAHATSLFQIHVDACRGLLPPTVGNQAMLYGKAIVFARRDALVPKTSYWIRESWMADIPAPGDRVQGGRPICTVFASARSAGACRRLLWRRAAWVYRNVNSRLGGRHESRS